MKQCARCKTEKPKTDFNKDASKKDGLVSFCRPCRKEYMNDYYAKNSEALKEKSRKWFKDNKERGVAARKAHYLNNPDQYKTRRKAQYWKNREENIKYSSNYVISRQKVDPHYRFALRCRKRIWGAFFESGYSKKTKTFELIGIEQKELIKYIESIFSEGMSWDNYGEWHIDHVIPFAAAKSQKELEALCHYTNLQPLWAKDNLSKSAKYRESHAREYFKRFSI